MSQIRFEFKFEKFVQALAYFAWRDVPALDKLKVAKLLYFADKQHLLSYGRPILGDTYFCLDHGPIPSASLNLLNEVLLNEVTEETDPSEGYEFRSEVYRYVDVDRSHKHPRLIKKLEPDLDVFSDSDVTVLDEVIGTYGSRTGWNLRELTHDEPTWKIPDKNRKQGSSAQIPYALFFAGQDDDKMSLLELVKDEQDDRDFAETLA